MVSVDDGRTSSADATETPNGAEQGQGGMQTVVEEVVPVEVDGESLEQGVVTTIDTDNKGGDSVEAVKVDATQQPPLLNTSLDRPSSVDGTSTHSLPYVSVTEPQSPLPPTSPTRIENSSSVSVLPTPTSASGVPPPSPIRSNMPTSPSSRRSLDRPQRRSTIDSRSPNRFSGFFNGLVSRRTSTQLPNSPHSPNTRQSLEERGASTASLQREAPTSASATTTATLEASGAREPDTPPRPMTPPPTLPPPTLSELGLNLSTVTATLSPSHFSSPPISGAFLAPHYLLLCHAQGLDVLPLVYPPVPQPYALVRRVSFKSVVVMEHRGVLVAIAGRRDGVRVYALEEVKKAVEWRVEVEVRRERDRTRREEAKKSTLSRVERAESASDIDSMHRHRLTKGHSSMRASSMSTLRTSRKSSLNSAEDGAASTVPPVPPRPQTASQKPKAPSPSISDTVPEAPPVPQGPPPAYTPGSFMESRPRVNSRASVVTVQPRAQRSGSVNDVLGAPVLDGVSARPDLHHQDSDIKGDWVERSVGGEEEAISVVAAGASGSQALDERTSAIAQGQAQPAPPLGSPGHSEVSPAIPLQRTSTSTTVRRPTRPADLDLTNALPDPTTIPTPQPQPSPVATLTTLRQALLTSSPSRQNSTRHGFAAQEFEPPETPEDDEDGPSEAETPQPGREQISFAQALLESRLPELPPPGSRRSQQPILITNTHPVANPDDEPSSPRSSDAHSHAFATRRSTGAGSARRRRRRWSVFDGIFNPNDPAAREPMPSTSTPDSTPPQAPSPEPIPPVPTIPTASSQSVRSRSITNRVAPSSTRAPSSSTDVPSQTSTSAEALSSSNLQLSRPPTPSHSGGGTGLISRILSSAFHSRRSEDRGTGVVTRHTDSVQGVPGHPQPAPKLEYVKLPGTKGALLIKAVETAKKSFLAILCGDNGEKVELFAGTYRTALGLSRTFILPDSPRSLELQLQGDDLVEVFLVFSQNVFGLEPATVRVREVRIGRAERRAARRRARDGRQEDNTRENNNAADDDTNVTVAAVVANENDAPAQNEDGEGAPLEPGATASAHTLNTSATNDGQSTPQNAESSGAVSMNTATEDAAAVVTTQMGPFTTFQQLSFAPQFPLASIADEYIIPPTYASFLQYRTQYEPDVEGGASGDLASVQFTPPGLPVPQLAPPSKWCYRDPKGVVHGPWKASLMQAWYKDGLLPPDLPVRKEEDTEYILLKDLRAQSVDPTHPFRPAPPPLEIAAPLLASEIKPLLAPLSLLAQPRHFGPPALFFSSRGGHSTTIVDARGRSVIKGRFVWTPDDTSNDSRMGDVRRLEAFDVKDRSVLVAMRQGGLEAVDLGDALLRPGDDSRPALPHFTPPDGSTNRRGSFLWRIGSPTGYHPSSSQAIASIHSLGSRTSHKKQNTVLKSPGRSEFVSGPEGDGDRIQDEVFFIGRKDDDVYLCERNAGTFRILRLCPDDL